MQIFLNRQNRAGGISLIEVLVAIGLFSILLTLFIGIYLSSTRALSVQRETSILRDTTKVGLNSLEWFFDRWGVGVPCFNPANPAQCANVTQGTDQNLYPPPTALYIVVNQGQPCDEVYFYGSLHGMGFVVSLRGISQVAIMSCRLSQGERHNCYHIWRGARVFLNQDPNSGPLNRPLIFRISGLSEDNLDCMLQTQDTNAVMDVVATALNGRIEEWQGNNRVFTDRLTLEAGDLLIRVPHRIRMFCRNNPQDENRLWLYVEATDMASNCDLNEPPMPLIPVTRFDVEVGNNSVLVTLGVLEENRTIEVIRRFGR